MNYLRITRKALKAYKLEDINASVEQYDVIGIDEGQFFPDVSSIHIRLYPILRNGQIKAK